MALKPIHQVTALPSFDPDPKEPPSHHIGIPPTAFQNPWDSSQAKGFTDAFTTKFFRSADKTNVPVPVNREGLVLVRKPDWGVSHPERLRATWIGHASFLVETNASQSSRGVRILLDPVFSERTSPVQWFGPKRYSPTPCTIDDLPSVDIIVLSHNHYDHTDSWTLVELWRISKAAGRTPIIACGLNTASFFLNLLPELTTEDILELDWWEGRRIDVESVGSVDLICTPAQHNSNRGLGDKNKSLWCSWTIREYVNDKPSRTLFFAGDTGYRAVNSPKPTEEEEDSMPRCPAFKQIGDIFGPIDLALLPIGLYSPRDFMSSVHCAPEDSACIHADLRSKKSIGMHYGTVRGGLSGQYEDVREPPMRWKAACEKKGYKWADEVGLCDIGETILV